MTCILNCLLSAACFIWISYGQFIWKGVLHDFTLVIITNIQDRYNSVCIVTRLQAPDRDTIPDKGCDFFPHQWVQTKSGAHLSNKYQGPILWGWSSWGVKLSAHLYVVPWLTMLGAVHPLP